MKRDREGALRAQLIILADRLRAVPADLDRLAGPDRNQGDLNAIELGIRRERCDAASRELAFLIERFMPDTPKPRGKR